LKKLVLVLMMLLICVPTYAAQITVTTGSWSDLRSDINNNFDDLYTLLDSDNIVDLMGLTLVNSGIFGTDSSGDIVMYGLGEDRKSTRLNSSH